MVAELPLEQILDGLALRIDGRARSSVELSIVFELSDTGEAYTPTLENAVLTHTAGRREGADATLRLERTALDELIAETATAADLLAAGRLEIEGDGARSASCSGSWTSPTRSSRS